MELTDVLLLVSAFTVILDISKIRGKNETWIIDPRLPTAIVSCVLVSLSYVYLAWAFVSNNFALEEVFLYSSSGLGWAERLYASWASSGGSWLFLSFLFAVGYAIIRMSQGEDQKNLKIYQFLDVIFLFIILVVLIQSPLKTLAQAPVEGRGLNPLLKTPWMLIHPPIVFIGYVMALFSLAFTFGSAESSPRLARTLASVSWLFLTLGIAIGGLWAYEVLGWGGFWAWDPVETSSLVPWLTLTAYFHLVPQLTGKKSMSRDTMLMVTSTLIVLASAITRGGLTVSVHAFGSSPIGYVLLTLMVVVVAYFVAGKRRRGYTLFEFDTDMDTVYNASMSIGFISLIMISVVSLWGIIFPIINSGMTGSEVSMDAAFFNKWTYPFALLFVSSLIGCHLHERLTLKSYTGVLGGAFALGLAAAFMGYPTSNMLANLGIPMTLFALLAVGYNLVNGLSRKFSALLLGRSLIHLGVVLIMAGILLGQTNVTEYGELVVSPGTSVDLGDIKLDFGQFNIIEPFGDVLVQSIPQQIGDEAAGLSIPVTIRLGSSQSTKEVYIMLYTLHGIVSRPTVIRTTGYDVYLVLHQSQTVYRSLSHILSGIPFAPPEFVISVSRFPLMNLLWVGTLLMCVGIIVPITMIREKKG
jgi:cytochrome c-type biogenesis protein CcmF